MTASLNPLPHSFKTFHYPPLRVFALLSVIVFDLIFESLSIDCLFNHDFG